MAAGLKRRKTSARRTSFDAAVKRAADEMRNELDKAREEEQRKLDAERPTSFWRWLKDADT
ncbi:hypothetical protein AB0N71_08950 [Pseudarthrobacter enclensis]|uniref:hypothetical protein n=1 Tax=Pseudarthrobacter enclensis TaxID=993070 RepID=UPI0034437FB0